jgi:NADPH:quinone reductase-like Zn-dependent oxidoreductase
MFKIMKTSFRPIKFTPKFSNQMKAVNVKKTNNQTTLFIDEIQIPNINKDEVLIQNKYSAVNRADLMQKSGNYPPPPGARYLFSTI